jgi:DNA invertase Pin-like site-specific DNA recombinase
MQSLIEDIKSGKIDVVLVYKIERLVRSLKDFTNYGIFLKQST